MIKYEKNGSEASIAINGTLPKITSDVMALIKLIYDRVSEQSELAGHSFKEVIKQAISDEFPFMTDEMMEVFVEGLAEKNEQGK